VRQPILPRGQPSRTRALDLPFIGVRRGPRCTMGGVCHSPWPTRRRRRELVNNSGDRRVPNNQQVGSLVVSILFLRCPLS
jgi:hypothetical protein